jgi:nicotinamide-nucleotide amidase
MQAEIITIGDEILIGQVADTNSSWIAGKLNLNGVKVRLITSIADDREQILERLSESEKHADLIILTGGLGPTRDDITKSTLCDFFGSKLVMNEQVMHDIEEFSKKKGVQLNELNRSQAYVPENCTVLPNKNGTAPGMWFIYNSKVFISLPGVPFEMKAMMEEEALPKIRSFFKPRIIYHKTIMTFGIPESVLAIKITKWENSLPENASLAYLPSPGIVRLRLSFTGDNKTELVKIAKSNINELQKIIPDAIFGFDNDNMEEVTGKLLEIRNKTLAVAESCTGGKISNLITSVPGCSKYFVGSVTAYSNNIKEQILNIEKESIIRHGAVSREVAEQMARGIRKLFGTDYSIATTGIAGPDGGTADKPVGTTWIAVSSELKTISEKFLFGDNRERNILRASLSGINMLRKLIISDC